MRVSCAPRDVRSNKKEVIRMKRSEGIVVGVEENTSQTVAGKPKPSKRLFTPSMLSKKLLCPAYAARPYMSEPRELRRQFDVLTRMSIIKTIMTMTKKGYRFVVDEQPSGNFSGTVDLVFEGPDGQPTKVEVKSSKYLKTLQILQSILYHETGDKIIVSSLNEMLEPDDWLIDPVKSTAAELDQFLQEYSEQAKQICVPHRDLCPRCANRECPRRPHVVQNDHHL